MRQLFLTTLFLCLFLSLTVKAQTVNSTDLLKKILDLPAPAPPNEAVGKADKTKERPEEFYDDDNAPPDDAPIEDLLDYWAKQNEGFSRLNYQLKPSSKTAERILEACEEDPKKLVSYLSILPSDAQSAEIVRKIYDNQLQDKGIEPYNRTRIKDWLKYNSNYYVEELVKEAQKIRDQDNYVQSAQQDVLLALAKVDWDSARPIVERLEMDSSQPYSQILARWIQYKHAVETDDSSAMEKYRRMLQDMVENKSAAWAQRDLAMDALAMSGDWQGRDEWYVSLLSDESLLTIQDNGYTGLTTLIAMSPPKKWTEKMLELVKSENYAVRSAAVRNLMNSLNSDGKNKKNILQALLHWLANPNWAKESRNGERRRLIMALSEVDLPESIPSLISIVLNEEEYRPAAIAALIKYKDSRAVPALKFALSKETEPEAQVIIIQALIASGGLSDDEQMTALEAYAVMISTPEGLARFSSFQFGNYHHETEETEEETEEEIEGETEEAPEMKLLPLEIVIGKTVGEQEEPGDGLVVRAVDRIKALRQENPAIADTLAEIMRKWKGKAIYAEVLRQIRQGEADMETILSVLAKRKDVREKIPNDLAALRASSGTAQGIGACLIEDESEFTNILGRTDSEAQTAMLACARLLRVKLPISEVGEFTNNPNKLLALAAERWLESEDSSQARTLVLAKHPNEAVILGARQAFVPEGKTVESKSLDAVFESVNGEGFWSMPFSDLKKNEEKLRVEIVNNSNITAIYAVLPDAKSGQQIIRVYKDKIVYTFEEDTARYREKTLTAKEFETFYNFIVTNKIDSLPPFNGLCEECESKEFVMFGRGGGRRIFTRLITDEKHAVNELFSYFESFKKGNLKLVYRLSDRIKDLEVLLADENLAVRSVWKKDADLRVLLEDKLKQEEIEKNLLEFHQSIFNAEIEAEDAAQQQQARYLTYMKKRAETAFAHYAWRNLQNNKPGEVVPQPSEVPFLNNNAQYLPETAINDSPANWQVRAGNVEIRTGELYEGGLYKITDSSNPVKLKEGLYANPIVTADGKWVVATKAETDWSQPKTVVRINLKTGREYKIAVASSEAFYPIAFVGSHNKVLLYRGKGNFLRSGITAVDSAELENTIENWSEPRRANAKSNAGPKVLEYYLFDAVTGKTQLIKGEFRPLIRQSVRPLQTTGKSGEVWAAIYDEKSRQTNVGRYSENTFVFQPLTKIPDINLSSMDVWVDEKEAKIYFVYLGHLLALPL